MPTKTRTKTPSRRASLYDRIARLHADLEDFGTELDRVLEEATCCDVLPRVALAQTAERRGGY